MLGQFLYRGLLLSRLEDDLSMSHHDKPIADTVGVIQVMRDQHTRQALRPQRAQVLEEGLGGPHRQRAGRVGKYRHWAPDIQHARHGDRLLLTSEEMT